MQTDRSNRMHLKTLLGLACGLAVLAPGAAFAAEEPPAVATITGPDTVTRGAEMVNWAGSCSNCGGMAVHYEWDRDNDGVVPEVDKGLYLSSIYNAYTTLGTHTIKLKTQGVDWFGGPTRSATTTKTITVVNATPDVDFDCEAGPFEAGEPVTCEIDVADDPDTDQPVALAWDVDGDGFDDGTGSEITKRFSTPGEQHVRLRGTDVDGGITEAAHSYEVWAPPAGQAFAMSATEIVEGNAVTFTAPYEAGEEGDTVYERRWDFDGDGDWDASGTDKRVVSRTFDEPGTYQVRLHVRAEGDPASAKITKQQLVVKPLPVVHPDPPKDTGNGGTKDGGTKDGGTDVGGGNGPAAPAPGPVAKAPAFVPSTRTAATNPAAKKPAVKRKTCKAAKKAKKGKRSRTCATKKRKSSRAKTRKRR